ncbi:hypothetical protein JK359_24590 [Streptomyces actinomycinicus]|uniref:Uncharacterized protein n=1 Tax=Streptomyces actinomycinicus TaxID=1695166 RepID=A0A937JS12_9ACTN|nr:hypothetical protein [Streptomyces actinomycinicus]MBL1085108.1 hypothetical protein [Streptomyces actinomycinicus]
MRTNEGTKVKRRAAMLLGTAVLASTLAAPTAFADGPSEIYLGKVSGTIKIGGFPTKYTYVDKQYRSTSMPNLRKHSIRITFPGCAIWRARAAVKWGTTYDTEQSSTKGCHKSILLTPIGDMNANVNLAVHQDPADMSATVVIKPVRRR